MATLKQFFVAGSGEKCVKWEHYFEVYESHLRKFVGTEARYLEIGVMTGGSLSLMQRYLGPQASTMGIDANQECLRLRELGFDVHHGSGADTLFLARFASDHGPFDIIVDDGGHVPDQQIVSFLNLFPALRDGGVYLVEDLHTTFWHGYQDSRFGINFYDFAKGLVEKLSLHHVDRWMHERFRQPLHQREPIEGADNFALNEIFGIHFYDSVAVFEKRRRTEPVMMQN